MTNHHYVDRYYVWHHPGRRLFPWIITRETWTTIDGKEYPNGPQNITARRTEAAAERHARRLAARQAAARAADTAQRKAEANRREVHP